MTGLDPELDRETRRLMTRYVIEVVERFGLCPWAAPARARGEVRIDVVADQPIDQIEAAIDRFVADPAAVVGLIALPTFAGGPHELRRLRDQIAGGRGGQLVAIADFHPEAALDLTRPERLVPYLRRAPEPTLQVVRHATLASLHRSDGPVAAADQLAALTGQASAPRDPVASVAQANLATVSAARADVEAALADIAADRAATRARLAGRTP